MAIRPPISSAMREEAAFQRWKHGSVIPHWIHMSENGRNPQGGTASPNCFPEPLHNIKKLLRTLDLLYMNCDQLFKLGRLTVRLCLPVAFSSQLWPPDHTLDGIITHLIKTNDRVIYSPSRSWKVHFVFRDCSPCPPPLPGQQGCPALPCPLHSWRPAGCTYQRWTALRYRVKCFSPNTPIRMSALIRGAVPSERTLAARWLEYEDRGNGLVLCFRASKLPPTHPNPVWSSSSSLLSLNLGVDVISNVCYCISE